MKQSVLVLIFFVFYQSTIAQKFVKPELFKLQELPKLKKINIDAKVGVAFPVGQFANADYNTETAGGAKMGLSMGVEFNSKLERNFGYGVELNGVINEFNTEPYDNYAKIDSVFLGIQSDNYFNLKMLGVLSYGISSENIETDLKVMLGPMFSTLPQQTFSFGYQNGVTTSSGSLKSSSVALCVGLGFVSRLYIKDFYIKTFADYTTSTVYHAVDYYATGLGVYSVGEEVILKMSWMTIGGGIGIRF